MPDPATVLSMSTGPRTRLWERRRTDADHLVLRVGTGQLPSEVVLDDPEQDDHKREVTWKIQDAPVTLPLRERGVVGIAGPGDSAQSIGRWIVAQSAVLHSPLDVQFYVLTENSAQTTWDWVRWLPHSRPSGAQDANVLIGTDAETVGARIGELTQLLDARQKAAKENGRQTSFTDPDIVVIWDGSRRLRSMPGVVRLLREGPGVSMYAICLDAEERFLPGECQAIVIAEPKPEEHVTSVTASREPARPGQRLPLLPGLAHRRARRPADRRAEAARTAAARRADGHGPGQERTARLRVGRLVRPSVPVPLPHPRHQRRDRGLGAARLQPAARRAPAGAADERRDLRPLAHGRAVDDGGRR